MTQRLFVYGTLAPGQPNERILAAIGGGWGRGTVRGHLSQAGWGAAMGYPGLVLDDGGPEIEGFIFTSDRLEAHWQELDEFEGPGYERIVTDVRSEVGVLRAHVYVLAPRGRQPPPSFVMPDPDPRYSWPPLSEPFATALREAVTFVRAEVDAMGVIATGTIVRGTHHDASDLDVYVLHEAPVRRRIQRFFGDRVPTEIFINPPAAVRRYFAEEHRDGRAVTAHMLVTGQVVLDRDPEVARLREEAARWLDRPSRADATARIRARYAAATRFEDAADLARDDPAAATLLHCGAVVAMLEQWCRERAGRIPRGKDLLLRVAELDPELGALARLVFSDTPFAERHAAAGAVADRTIGTRGFFEWDSGFEPVPEEDTAG